MRTRLVGNWVTTVMGVLGAILMVLGIFYPEKVDPETQETIKTAVNEILVGVGALISVITNLFAKDN